MPKNPQPSLGFPEPEEQPKKPSPERFEVRQGYFQHGAARHSDPETSKDAAKSVDANNLEMACLNCLRIHGPCTNEEVADYIGRPLQSITPRFAPLRRKGFIVDAGKEHRRKGKTGRLRTVWKLTNS